MQPTTQKRTREWEPFDEPPVKRARSSPPNPLKRKQPDDESARIKKAARRSLSQSSSQVSDLTLNQHLPPELLVQIVSFLKLKDIYAVMRTDRLFARLVWNLIPKDIWLRKAEQEFPQSFSYLVKKIQDAPTEAFRFCLEEFRVNHRILKGPSQTSAPIPHVPRLKSLHSYEDIAIACSQDAIQGFLADGTECFKLDGSFLDGLVHGNILYAFMRDLTVQVYTLGSRSCTLNESTLIYAAPNPIEHAKMQWPYLAGFSATHMHIWNVENGALEPITIPKENGYHDFIGIVCHQLVYVERDEQGFLRLCVQSLQTIEKKTFVPPRRYSFLNETYQRIHIELTPNGLVALLFEDPKKTAKPQEALLNIDESESQDDINGKNALESEEKGPSYHKVLVMDFVQDTQFKKIKLLQKPSHATLYNEVLYFWHQQAGVVGAFDTIAREAVSVPCLQKKEWSRAPKNPYAARDAKGLKVKLINGIVHMRWHLLDLAANCLIKLDSTLCKHQHYALDYRKAAYLPRGKLIVGYPCGEEEKNLKVLDFQGV